MEGRSGMDIKGKVALVTGAGRGIGRAICREFARRGASGIAAADLDGDLARATAAELGGLDLQCDVADAAAMRAAVAATEKRFGRLDVLVSNAGFGVRELDLDDALASPDETWQRMWDVHVMAHVHACRAALPGMLARGSGCLVNVASAAGLLSQTGDTPYSVTKHAAVGLAESLAMLANYGIVSPNDVRTPALGAVRRALGVLTPRSMSL
jgi:NAD(P)-dependent dehydrogenase (short-subunit alcohol dehydrogenase family)